MAEIIEIGPLRVEVPNEARMEVMYSIVEGLPPARQKRLIVMCALEEVGFLTAMQAEVLLDSLGLRAA